MSESSSVSAQLILRALLDQGLTAVAYCAGSRNAPFAYALAQAEQTEGLQVQTFVDERAASFWALGAARQLTGTDPEDTTSPRRWTAVFTTSGTAITHIQGALEEAKHTHLPLLAVTADRPGELIGTAASQTTEQQGFFDLSVESSLSIPPLGSLSDGQSQQWYAQVARLLCCKGPAHLNVQFRDPLTPASSWKANQPLNTARTHKLSIYPTVPVYPHWDEVIEDIPETVVVAGDRASKEVGICASNRGIPILAEPSSGLCDLPTWIPHGSMSVGHLKDQVRQIVVTGRPTLSRPITSLLAAKVRKVVVSADRPWPDQSGTATLVVPQLAGEAELPGEAELLDVSCDKTWLQQWLGISNRIEKLFQAHDGYLNLFSAARMLWNDPHSINLWLGASNTVRAFDLAAAPPPTALLSRKVLSNRGLAGIDGTIASAMGAAAVSEQPWRAVMGDLTFAHDLTSLPAAIPAGFPDRLGRQNTELVVFNDAGGSIFASLEHGDQAFASIFRKYFAIEQTLDIAAVGAACGWKTTVIDQIDQLHQTIADGPSPNTLLEVKIDPPTQLLKDLREQAKAL